MKSKLKVAMLAPPWLPVPPEGYGGIENVIFVLVSELAKLGVEVVLFTTGDSKVSRVKKRWLYPKGQYSHIHDPQYDAVPILAAHILFALNKISSDGKFDIIHDHTNAGGLFALSHSDPKLPPVIHTLHNPRFAHESDKPNSVLMWQELAKTNRIKLVPMSEAMAKSVPRNLKPLTLSSVHNGINCHDFPFVTKKSNYFMTLGRFHPEKGQHLAVRACLKLGYRLKMAGVVGDLGDPKKLLMELANPLSTYRGVEDFRYYSDNIFPHLLDGKIENLGEVRGKRKLKLLGKARALLFPIQWEEPFGMVAIEALACGTPVIAMARGALPEIIEHGVNGFLVNSEAELRKYMQRIDEIDPQACRQSVEERFSAEIMANHYLNHYKSLIKRS